MIEVPVLTITRKQLIATATAISLSVGGWTTKDYVETRDIARSAKQQAQSLERDVRETRQGVLEALIMMNRQFTGDDREIARLDRELKALKAEQAKEVK